MGDIRKGANEDPKDSCNTGGTAHSGRCPEAKLCFLVKYITTMRLFSVISNKVHSTSRTPYTQQSYKVSESFPFKWIIKKWKEGFHTSMTTAGSRWGVIVKNC
ncbi:hypothetical protein GQ457_06G020370 [Hibiscus cannabinus]